MTSPHRPHILVLAIVSLGTVKFHQTMKDVLSELNNDGYNADGVLLEDSDNYDELLQEYLDKGPFELISIGSAVRGIDPWYMRVNQIIANSSSKNAIITKPNGPQECTLRIREAMPLPTAK